VKQSIPVLFQEIMRNDRERLVIKALNVVSNELREKYWFLRRERQDYRRAAEAMLRWNTNKGTTA
jgi:hypothetical protein